MVDLKKYTWSEDVDDELWQRDDFDTIEECIEDAVENYGYEKGEKIAVAETKEFVPSVFAEMIFEQIEQDAYEECGEAAEDWRIYCEDKGSVQKLSDKITELVNEWLKETGNKPDFYKIVNARYVDI